MKLPGNQKGFGLVEGLLVIIALTLIVGVGYYVYSQNKSDDSSQQSTGTAATSQSTQPAKQETKYFEFKELGVKIPLNEGLDGLSYQVEDNYLFLTTNKITAEAKKCDPGEDFKDASSTSFASLSRATGTYPSNPGLGDGVLQKQFNGFYVAAGYPNGTPCAVDATYKQLNDYARLVSKAKEALKQAFKNARAI